LILPDVNVLVLAHHSDVEDHRGMQTWLKEEVNSDRPFFLADVVVAGFLRTATNSKIFRRPTPLARAVAFVDGLVAQPTCLPVSAGERHWRVLRELLLDGDARANNVPDAHIAAIALEHGATVATRDRGFARFERLSWFDPLADAARTR
jgi:toxin-antitoxin system PIN domain toxin